MDFDKKDGFSYLDGVPIRISSKFCPPRPVTLPIAADAKLPTDLLSLEYDFSLEKQVLEFIQNKNAEKEAAKASTDNSDAASKIESMSNLSNKEGINHTHLNRFDTVLNPNNSNILPLQPNIILQPQKPQSHSDEKETSKKINLSDFENETSTPFDYIELQTINDLEELSSVFEGLNNSEPCITKGQAEQQEVSSSTEKLVVNNEVAGTVSKSISFPITQKNSTGFPYSERAITNKPEYEGRSKSVATLSSNKIVENRLSLSYPNVAEFVSDVHSAFNTAEVNFSSGSSNCSALSQVPNISSNLRYSLTGDQNVCASKTAMRGSKSYSDLSNLPSEKSISNSAEERPQTPPTKMFVAEVTDTPIEHCLEAQLPVYSDDNKSDHATVNCDNNIQTNSPGLLDPYHELDENAQQVVNSITDMGFLRAQVSRTVKHLGTDEKKVIEHLCQIQSFEESGYDNLEAEAALHLHDYNRTEAKAFLDLVNQFQDLGFEKNAVKKALVQNKNDWNKTIDALLA